MEQTLGNGPPKAPKAAPSSTRGKSRAMPATAACGGNGGRQLGDGRRKAGETEKSKRLPIWMALKGIRFTLSILIPMKYCVKIAIFYWILHTPLCFGNVFTGLPTSCDLRSVKMQGSALKILTPQNWRHFEEHFPPLRHTGSWVHSLILRVGVVIFLAW